MKNLTVTVNGVAYNVTVEENPNGAAPVAAIMSGKIDTANKKTVCVVSGGNIDSSRLIEVMTRGIKKREEE